MKNFVFYLLVGILALWLLCNAAEAAGRRTACQNESCGASQNTFEQDKNLLDWWNPKPTIETPPVVVEVPVTVDVKPTQPAQEPAVSCDCNCGNALKKVGSTLKKPIQFFRERKPVRKVLGKLIRRCE